VRPCGIARTEQGSCQLGEVICDPEILEFWPAGLRLLLVYQHALLYYYAPQTTSMRFA
jgi:hypothetical protein